MSVFKFIHCADLHLGSRAYGVVDADPSFGKRLTEAAFKSFSKIVDRAISENVDFLVISGDIFDETSETPATRFRFASELERVKIPVFICLGNHDHVMSWTESIPYPENVHVFSKEPESKVVDIHGIPVEVIGRSFPSLHSSVNPTVGINGRQDMFSIACIHCSVEEVAPGNEYGPCRLSDMIGKNVDYWALGHIHKRTEVCRSPYVIYPGNIQGRHTKESGEKGAYLITVNDEHVVDLRFFATQDVLWQSVDVDICGMKDMNSFISRIRDVSKDKAVLSITVTGIGNLDPVIRRETSELIKLIESATECKVAEMILKTYPDVDRDKLAEGKGLVSLMIRSSDRLNSLSREQLIDEICSTKQSKEIRNMVEWLDDEQLRALVHDAETYLVNKMAGV